MVNALTPGYLRWDGTKIVSDTNISIAGPTGPMGPAGTNGTEGPTGATGPTGPAGSFSGSASDLTAGDGSVVTLSPPGITGLDLTAGTLSVNLSVKQTNILGIREKFFEITGATGTVVHNCTNGQIFYHTAIANNFTVNLFRLYLTSKFGTSIILVLDQGATPYLPIALEIEDPPGVALLQTIEWQGGSPPTGNANKIDIVSFSILNNAGTYTVLGQLTTFG